MSTLYYISHPDVVLDPHVPVPRWPLSERGRARMRAALDLPWIPSLARIFCSDEQKALDGAEILGEGTGLPITVLHGLGENDRSSTGVLPPDEFQRVADAFFARPEESVRGWETASDAQRRIVAAIEEVFSLSEDEENVAVVAHGGVGALLLCHLKGAPISRAHDQPFPPPGSPPGSGGGHYYAFDRATRELHHDWRPIAPWKPDVSG